MCRWFYLKDVRTRWDVSFIQSNLAAELSAGHTYTFGGDVENVPRQLTGFLGIDWEMKDNLYRIKRIVMPAVWDTEVRSPFYQPGVDVRVGDYILAVNGTMLDPEKDPYAAFEGLSGTASAAGGVQPPLAARKRSSLSHKDQHRTDGYADKRLGRVRRRRPALGFSGA